MEQTQIRRFTLPNSGETRTMYEDRINDMTQNQDSLQEYVTAEHELKQRLKEFDRETKAALKSRIQSYSSFNKDDEDIRAWVEVIKTDLRQMSQMVKRYASGLPRKEVTKEDADEGDEYIEKWKRMMPPYYEYLNTV